MHLSLRTLWGKHGKMHFRDIPPVPRTTCTTTTIARASVSKSDKVVLLNYHRLSNRLKKYHTMQRLRAARTTGSAQKSAKIKVTIPMHVSLHLT